MTNEVLQYRPFAMEDLSDIAHILAPLWHSDVPEEVQLLHAVIDFASYAQRATFSEVAVKRWSSNWLRPSPSWQGSPRNRSKMEAIP